MKLSNRRRNFRFQSSSRGFTLIELMIVLVVMGIVITFVGPRVVGGLMGLNTRTATLKTAAMLRYARSKAVNTGCRYHVIFDGIKQRVILLQAASEQSATPQPLDTGLDTGRFDGDLQVPESELDDVNDVHSVELEKKVYPLPDGVFFDNMIIADVDSADLGDEMIMMLSFSPNGTSLGAILTISDKRGRLYFITIEPVSGSVRVNEESEDD